MNFTLKRVLSLEQVERVVQLANVIWTEHYRPIIGQSQVDYMLRHFQSASAIANEINNINNHYYLLYGNGEPVGYVGVKIETQSLFLSKIYVLSSERGKGFGNKAITFIRELATSKQLSKITLTVNKGNIDTIAAYKRIGFKITGEICMDIGGGYVMDDYQMALEL